MTNSANIDGLAPPGWHTVTPRIVVHDPAALVEFLSNVFGAEGACLPTSPSIVRIRDSNVMIAAAGARGLMNAFLYVYVMDVDLAYERAIQLGATSLENPFDTPYGDRRYMVETCGAIPGRSQCTNRSSEVQ
jgi:PhnB protein